MGSIGDGREKLDGAVGEISLRIEFPFLLDCELATPEKAGKGELECRVKDCVVRCGVWMELGNKVAEDGQRDWEPWFAILFTVISADAADEALDNRVFCS